MLKKGEVISRFRSRWKYCINRIKRDVKDITTRKEPFEFQAIRYAASFAKIKNVSEISYKILCFLYFKL
jgi:hypothetical protein